MKIFAGVIACLFTLSLFSCKEDSIAPTDTNDTTKQQTEYLFPLAVGNKWIYHRTFSNGSVSNDTLVIIEEKMMDWYRTDVNGVATFVGKARTFITNTNDGYGLGPDGIWVSFGSVNQPGDFTADYEEYLPNTPKAEVINVEQNHYTWTDTSTVTVPAGTYSGVWKVEVVYDDFNNRHKRWYKKGIGMLRLLNDEDDPSFEETLAGYSFK